VVIFEDYSYSYTTWYSPLSYIVLTRKIGAIFGAALTFREFKGVLWYAVSKQQKLRMVLIANLCMIPSWIFFWYQFTDITFVQRGANMYILNAIHFFILYFVLFGILPKHVFAKLGLLNQKSAYYLEPEDLMVVDGKIFCYYLRVIIFLIDLIL